MPLLQSHTLLGYILVIGVIVADNPTEGYKKRTYRGLHTLDKHTDYDLVSTQVKAYIPDERHKQCAAIETGSCKSVPGCDNMAAVPFTTLGANYVYCYPEYPENWVDMYEVRLKGRCTWAAGGAEWTLLKSTHFEAFISKSYTPYILTKHDNKIQMPQMQPGEGKACVLDIVRHSHGIVHTQQLRQAKDVSSPMVATCFEQPAEYQLNVVTFDEYSVYTYGNYTSEKLQGYTDMAVRKRLQHSKTCWGDTRDEPWSHIYGNRRVCTLR